MPAKKKETVSASFHYLVRLNDEGSREYEVPFSDEEFSTLFEKMKSQKPVDLTNEKEVDKLRFRIQAPLENVQRPNPRTISGTFKGSYWGHAYDNTSKGRIPAASVNLRPFHFIIYHSKSGRLYLGSQYLGLFGGYEALRKTVVDLLPQKHKIQSRSFRIGAGYYAKAVPKEIRVNVANKSSRLAGRSQVGGKMMVALSRADKNDPMVERVRKSILPFFGGQKKDIQKAVAHLITQSGVIDINDEDVLDCTILADWNGGTRTIYMFDAGHHATRFPLDVTVDDEGHPENSATCNKMIKVLRDSVISATEDV